MPGPQQSRGTNPVANGKGRPLSVDGPSKQQWRANQSGLRLRLRAFARRPLAALAHELIELRPILGKAQALEKFLELALFFFEPLQRLAAIIVKGAVAARRRRAPAGAAAPPLHLGAHAVHLLLHAFHLPLPTAR